MVCCFTLFRSHAGRKNSLCALAKHSAPPGMTLRENPIYYDPRLYIKHREQRSVTNWGQKSETGERVTSHTSRLTEPGARPKANQAGSYTKLGTSILSFVLKMNEISRRVSVSEDTNHKRSQVLTAPKLTCQSLP